MQLLDHVSITVTNLAAAKPFYRAIMAALGAQLIYDEVDGIGFGERNSPQEHGHSYLSIFESPLSIADPRRHWCLRAKTPQHVDAFYNAGLAHGGTDAGQPGLRDYHPGYYAAFILDAEGNKIEAVCHGS